VTPAARLAAAIGVLDAVAAGARAEAALTGWARGARYAGSGDRTAVRDHVFDALRRRRSLAALGGAATGRGLMLGALRAAGTDPAGLFTGAGHAPAPLTASEARHLAEPVAMTEAEALDCPDWLAPALRESLGGDFVPVMQALQARAPVFLRANLARAAPAAACAALAAEGIAAHPHPLAPTALRVEGPLRGLQATQVWQDGLVELQDAASQAVCAALPLVPGARVLDHCAGGGGKALAIAARLAAEGGGAVFAHDAAPRRMADLPVRAARAGTPVALLDDPAAQAPFDLVLTDVPCSGSGSWRRDPEGKWRLTPERLAELLRTQAEILDAAARLVAPAGTLAYATCSLLEAENGAQVAAFLARAPGWRRVEERRWTPRDGADGFHLALLTLA
jgi:16S rRNA (cytosine967-C5)-methyltransferase